jgi:hypothetical protein
MKIAMFQTTNQLMFIDGKIHHFIAGKITDVNGKDYLKNPIMIKPY